MKKAKGHHRHPVAVEAPPPDPRASRNWPALTGLRGIAAAGVLLFHIYTLAGSPASVPAPLAWLCSTGWSGVDVFFTLSAFLLAMPFCEAAAAGTAAPPLRDYWRHRAWRILPAYYVQLAIIALLAFAGAAAAASWRAPDAASLAANALFLYGIVPGISPAVPPWWTLPVELGFYLLLPFFARLLTPTRWPWLMLAIAASLAWRFGIVHAGLERAQEVAWTEHLPGRLHEFLVGMLAAWALVRWRPLFASWSVLQRDLVALLSILAFLGLPALAIPSTGRPYNGAPGTDALLLCWHLFASVVVAMLLVVLAAGASRVGRLLAAGWLQALGLLSYSLYLWHYPVLLALRDALGGFRIVNADFWPFAFYAIVFAMVVAGASWWLVERPAQQRARRDKMPA